MRILLDTAAALWISYDASRLSAVARSAYEDLDNTIFLSVASLWEIIVKNRIGKLPLPMPLAQLVDPLIQSRGVEVLKLTKEAVFQLQSLPDLHRDPFDRMLICQAIEGGLTLLTPDAVLQQYPVQTLW